MEQCSAAAGRPASGDGPGRRGTRGRAVDLRHRRAGARPFWGGGRCVPIGGRETVRGLAMILLVLLLLPTAAKGQALQMPSADQGRLRANHIRYDAKAKAYLAEGDVRLTLGDAEVRAPAPPGARVTDRIRVWGGDRPARRHSAQRAQCDI